MRLDYLQKSSRDKFPTVVSPQCFMIRTSNRKVKYLCKLNLGAKMCESLIIVLKNNADNNIVGKLDV